MSNNRRLFEEITMSLLLKQIKTVQLDYLVENITQKYFYLETGIQQYISEKVIPLIIRNFKFIKDNKLLSNDKLTNLKSNRIVAEQTYNTLSQTNADKFTLDDFENYLGVLVLKQDETLKNNEKLVFDVLTSYNKDEGIGLFLNIFYWKLRLEYKFDFIKNLKKYNNDIKLEEALVNVSELNGFPGVLYAPISKNNNIIDLIEEIIEIETSLQTDQARKEIKSYLTSTTVYDFYIQLMIDYNINIDLFELRCEELNLTIGIDRKDFSKTLVELLFNDGNQIHTRKGLKMVIRPLNNISLSNEKLYFDDTMKKLKDDIQPTFDTWWNRISNLKEIFNLSIYPALTKALLCEIKETKVTSIISNFYSSNELIYKDNLIDKIINSHQSICLLHFIIGFDIDKGTNSIKPYTRNTQLSALPRYGLNEYNNNSNFNNFSINENTDFLARNPHEKDEIINSEEYQHYFECWLKINHISSAYLDDSKVAIDSLFKQLSQSPPITEYNQKINLISKIILYYIKANPPNSSTNYTNLNIGDPKHLYKNEYLFILYYYIICSNEGSIPSIDFKILLENYNKSKSVKFQEIIDMLFNNIMKGSQNLVMQWLIYLATDYRAAPDQNKKILWKIIEIMNLIKRKETNRIVYNKFKDMISTSEIMEFLSRPGEGMNGRKINQYLLFTATYYYKDMINEEQEFNNEIYKFFIDSSRKDEEFMYCAYYYLIKTKKYFYPLTHFNNANLNEINLASILIQIYSIDQFRSSILGTSTDENSNTSLWLGLFKDMKDMKIISPKSYKVLEKYIQTPFELIKLIENIFDQLTGKFEGIKRYFRQDESFKPYSGKIEYKSDILIVKSHEVAETIGGNYTLKGYWIKVGDGGVHLYYSYCRISDEWYLLTSNFRRVDPCDIIKEPRDNIISIYVKNSIPTIDAQSSLINVNSILNHELILKYPYTFIELCFTNTSYLHYIFRAQEYLKILKEYFKFEINNKKPTENTGVIHCYRYLLNNFKKEAETNEYYKENIIKQIRRLIEKFSKSTTKKNIN